MGPAWNPIVKYVIPTVMIFILGNYAWTNFGAPEMIGGVIVLVTFPLLGYAIISAVGSPDPTTPSQTSPKP